MSSGTGISWSSLISDTTLPFAYEVTVHSTISHLENLSGLVLTKCTRPSASDIREESRKRILTCSFNIVRDVDFSLGELNRPSYPRLTEPSIISIPAFISWVHGPVSYVFAKQFGGFGRFSNFMKSRSRDGR